MEKEKIVVSGMTKTTHYATLAALLISNLTVLTLGGLFSTQMGLGMASIASYGDQVSIQKSLAASKRIAPGGNGPTGPTGPRLNVSLGDVAPSRVIDQSDSNYLIGAIRLQAVDKELRITELEFTVLPPDNGVVGTYADIAAYHLGYVSGEGPGINFVEFSAPITSRTTRVTLPTPMRILQGATNPISVTLDLYDFYTRELSSSGAGVTVQVSGVKAETVSGPQSDGVVANGVGASFKPISLVKAYPRIYTTTSIALAPLDRVREGLRSGYMKLRAFFGIKDVSAQVSIDFPPEFPREVELYRMTIGTSRDGMGVGLYPIGLQKITYRVNLPPGVTLDPSEFRVYRDHGGMRGDLFAAPEDIMYSNGLVTVRFDVNQDDPAPHNRPGTGDFLYVIDSGYMLLLTGMATGMGSISTELVTDTAFAGAQLMNAAEVEQSGHSNFIWSDLNFDLMSSSTATVTKGWFNGYRVFPR